MNSLKKTTTRLFVFMSIILSSLFIQSCNNDDDTQAPLTDTNNVNLSNSSVHGNILVDSEGKTLYFFTQDTKGQSVCEAGPCLTNWPIFYKETVIAGTGLTASDFSTITRADGQNQTTYKGWPLYYFVNDNNPGETSGDAVNGAWFVAKPDYSLMLAEAQLVGNDGKNYTGNYTEGEGLTQYLVDGGGRTLYAFLPDTKNKNNFTKPDFSNDAVWPIFYLEIASLPSTLNKADFDEIDVFGRLQLTFKGWPLYHFGQDTERGDNKGVSVPNPGVWPILNNASEQAPEALPEENVMLGENSSLGNILVDGAGNTLYFFTPDVKGDSKCAAGNCLNNWPIFHVEGVVAGEGLEATDFATITREDGAKQTTFKGWPLYYFSSDSEPGDVNGEGINDVWFVAKPNYSIMLANAQLIGNDGKMYTSQYVEGEEMTQYFVDAEGRTLYIFKNDSHNQNNFTNDSFSNDGAWPIFHLEIESLPSTLTSSDFQEIDVHGRPQLTYKGWPLYYFGQDGVRGETKGVSVPSPGVWPIVNTDTEIAQ